jgi:glycosyltransferase involved in cell wall biosynthesis
MPSGNGFFAWIHALWNIYRAARASRVVVGTLELQSIFWAALLGKGKSVGWLHKDLVGYFAQKPGWYVRLYTAILGWAFSRCATIVCVSQGVRDSARALFPASAAKLQTVYNPIDFAAIETQARETLPASLANCFTKPVILGVGRLAPEKAFHTLIQAHALLRGQGSGHNLCILGEGPERGFLERETERLGVRGSTFMPGFMNPYPAMRQAAVLGVSSVFEGFPTVIMEALSLGLPVVSTDCPHGPAEILSKGTCGLLTPINNPEALAQALFAMLSGKNREAYVGIGLTRVQDFRLENTLPVWEEVLLQPSRQRLSCNAPGDVRA